MDKKTRGEVQGFATEGWSQPVSAFECKSSKLRAGDAKPLRANPSMCMCAVGAEFREACCLAVRGAGGAVAGSGPLHPCDEAMRWATRAGEVCFAPDGGVAVRFVSEWGTIRMHTDDEAIVNVRVDKKYNSLRLQLRDRVLESVVKRTGNGPRAALRLPRRLELRSMLNRTTRCASLPSFWCVCAPTVRTNPARPQAARSSVSRVEVQRSVWHDCALFTSLDRKSDGYRHRHRHRHRSLVQASASMYGFIPPLPTTLWLWLVVRHHRHHGTRTTQHPGCI